MRLVFSERELGKLFIMIVLATLLFGATGLVGMLVMQWVTRQRYAKDDQDKHGISEINASRLGGAVIIGLSLFFLFYKYLTGYQFDDVGPMGIHPWGWLAFLTASALGLVEDIDNDLLSPILRLFMLGLFFGLTFLIWPEVIPSKTGNEFIDLAMSQPIMGWLLAVVFAVGFINAINMADGANGLVPGIMFISALIYSATIGALVWEVLSIVTGVFLIFNVISGRLFLGDAGAYGIGTILVLGGFYSVNRGYVGLEFVAVMMCYPCLEVVCSMVRRKIAGRSMFKPDNFHLHNYIHEHLRSISRSRTAANSVTGLIITFFTTGIAFLGQHFNIIATTDPRWGWIFLLQVVFYGCIYMYLSSSSEATNKLADN